VVHHVRMAEWLTLSLARVRGGAAVNLFSLSLAPGYGVYNAVRARSSYEIWGWVDTGEGQGLHSSLW